MKIKKIYLFILFIAVFLLIYSCGSRFNPRYYYNKNLNTSAGYIGGGNLPDDFDPDIEDDPFDNPSYTNQGGDTNSGDSTITNSDGSTTITKTVYLDPFQNGEWNDPNYRFSMNFDNMVIRASFDGNNRPSYKLVNGGWNSGNSREKSYYYNGPDTSAAGNHINSVQYWLYKGRNPLFKPDARYNKTNRIERFYFYRFNGKALGLVYIDNYLIAIDKYSKLVFGFAVPVEWKQYVAGTPKAPVNWGSVELGYEIDKDSGGKASFKVNGASYFYEYDPVGILKSDGTIEMYQWCLNSIGNNSRYGPRIEGNNARDTSRAIATYGKPGRSPYIPIQTNITVVVPPGGNVDDYINNGSGGGGIIEDDGEITKDIITVTAKSFKSIKAYSWHYNVYLSGNLKRSVGFYNYKIGAAIYDDSFPSGIRYLASMNDVGGITPYEDLLKLDWNEQVNLSGSQTFEVEDIKNKDVYIELGSDIAKYNLNTIYVDTAGFGRYGSGSGWIAQSGSQKITFLYNDDKGAFEIYSKRNQNTFSDMSINNNFTLKRGEKKDYTIRYLWKGITGFYECADVTYTLEFKSAS